MAGRIFLPHETSGVAPIITLRPFAALCVLALATASARADVILDDFTNPTPGAQFVIANTNSNPYTLSTSLPGALRTATFTVTSPTPAGPFSLLGVIGGGTMDMFFDSTSSGNAVVNYAFASPLNLSGIGGSAGAIRFTTQSAASIGNPDIAYTLNIQTATSRLGYTASGTFANSTGFVDQDVSLAGLVGTGDLSQVTGLTLTVNAQTADDFRLDKIAVTEPQQVPAPAGVLLAFAALPVLGLRRFFGRAA